MEATLGRSTVEPPTKKKGPRTTTNLPPPLLRDILARGPPPPLHRTKAASPGCLDGSEIKIVNCEHEKTNGKDGTRGGGGGREETIYMGTHRRAPT